MLRDFGLVFGGSLRPLRVAPPFSPPTLHPPLTAEASTTTLKLLSWNLLAPCYVRPPQHEWLPRTQRQIEFVARSNADIIALQEVWTANEDYLQLWRTFAGEHGFTMSVTPRTNAKPDGCAMLVRQPALACEFSAYDYDDWGSRIVQVGKLRLPGLAEPLCVMNTHLTFPHASAHDPPMRRQQGRKLAELVRTHTQPLCVVGDFNGALSDPAVQLLTSLGGLRPPPARPSGEPDGAEWVSHVAHTQAAMACDLVLTRNACRCKEWSLGGSRADLDAGAHGALGSDHRPVLATIEVGAAALEAEAAEAMAEAERELHF